MMKTKQDPGTPAAVAQLRTMIDKFDGKMRMAIRSARAALRRRFPTANEHVYDYGHSLVISDSP